MRPDTCSPSRVPVDAAGGALRADAPRDDRRPYLLVDRVSKVYRDARSGAEIPALETTTLEVSCGEFVALVGPSGCGKSTLLKVVAGLEQPSAGLVYFEGSPIDGPSWKRGMVFQEYALAPWKTVAQNVGLGPKVRGLPRQVRAALVARFIGLVGLSGFEDRFPHELSGGMRQRCAIARTLANDPGILLMDEPFAAVDAQTREILQEELLAIWGDSQAPGTRKTVLLVTHAIEEALFLADRIVVMTARPGSVKEEFVNPLPRPRDRTVKARAEFAEAREYLWQMIKEEALRAMHQGPR